MDARLEQQIRERAYHIWIEAGMMPGADQEHWVAAEHDITAKLSGKSAVSKRATASRAKPVTSAPTTAAKTKASAAKPVAAKAKTSKSAKANAEVRASLN